MEKLLQPCKMMKHLREKACKHPEIKKECKKSISGVEDLLHGRCERLALKGKPVSTIDSVEKEKVVALQQHLSAFEGLDTNKLIKQHTRTVALYQECLAKHCRQRQYIFQIRKCNERSCCSATCVSDDSLK